MSNTPIQYDANGNPILTKGPAPSETHSAQFQQDPDLPYKTEEYPKTIIQYYRNRKVLIDRETGKEMGNIPYHSQYGSEDVQQILKDRGDKVLYTRQNFGGFNRQSRGNTGNGTYTSSKDNAFDWEDLKARHGDWIDQKYAQSGGWEGFVKDLQDPARSGVAAGWFQKRINEYMQKLSGKNYFKDPVEGQASPYDQDGKFGQVTFSVPRFFDTEEAPAEKPPVSEANLDQEQIQWDQAKKEKPDAWYLQDTANLAASLTDPINRYAPQLIKPEVTAPEYSLLDPSRQLASIKEQSSRYSDLVQNTSEGAVARANILADSGEAGARAADILSNYENQNIQISNNGAIQQAAAYNQEQTMGAAAMDQYVQRMAVLNQNQDNAFKDRKYDQLAAFTNGVTNNHRKKMMEQVLFPDTYQDPVSGDWSIRPSGRDATNSYETYQSASGVGGAGGYSADDLMEAQAKAAARAQEIGLKHGLGEKALEQFTRSALDGYRPSTQQDKSTDWRNRLQQMQMPQFQNRGSRYSEED